MAIPILIEIDPEPDRCWCPCCGSTKVRREELPPVTRRGELMIPCEYECMDCGAKEVL